MLAEHRSVKLPSLRGGAVLHSRSPQMLWMQMNSSNRLPKLDRCSHHFDGSSLPTSIVRLRAVLLAAPCLAWIPASGLMTPDAFFRESHPSVAARACRRRVL